MKKKLETYLASGLLEQFQGPPNVVNMNSASTFGIQLSHVNRVEEEDSSECSQGSNGVNCAQFEPITENAASSAMDSFKTQESSGSMGHDLEQYAIYESATTGFNNSRFSSHELARMSCLGAPEELSVQLGTSGVCITSNENHTGSTVVQKYEGFSNSDTVENLLVDSVKLERLLISENDCSKITFSESTEPGCFPQEHEEKRSNGIGLYSSSSSLLCQFDIESSITARTSPLESFVHGKDVSERTLELDVIPSSRDDFICVDSPTCEADKADNYVKLDKAKNTPKLVAVDIFSKGNSDSTGNFLTVDENKTHSKADSLQTIPEIAENATMQTEEQDLGTLSCEPPCFPRLDIPLFNCDLVESAGDLHHNYSPFGIRQLMMPSASPRCLLLDSPIRDSTPRAALRHASKNFNSSTPSLMKKRLHEILSPVKERRGEIKLDREIIMRSSSFSCAFSSLDSIFDDNSVCRMSISSIEDCMQDVTSMDYDFEEGTKRVDKLDSSVPEKDERTTNSSDKLEQESMKVDAEAKTDDIDTNFKVDKLEN